MKGHETSQQFLKENDCENLAVRNGSIEVANRSIDYYPPTNCGANFGPNFDIEEAKNRLSAPSQTKKKNSPYSINFKS